MVIDILRHRRKGYRLAKYQGILDLLRELNAKKFFLDIYQP